MLRPDPQDDTMPEPPAIIIIHWGPWAPTRRLVAQLLAEPTREYEVVVFANETEPESGALRELGCTTLVSRENLGYAGAINAAIARLSARPAYLIANNDIDCAPAVAIDLLTQARAPGVGACGPVTINVDGSVESAGVDLAFDDPYVVQHRFEPPASTPLLTPTRSVQGNAYAFSRETYVEAGPWDERYFYGWEETDWCLRLEALGKRNVILGRARIHHTESASLGGPHGYNPIIEFMLLRNMFGFVARWCPRAVPALVEFWSREAERTSTRYPGQPPADPGLARAVVDGALHAFEAGVFGRWPSWLEALRPAPLEAGT